MEKPAEGAEITVVPQRAGVLYRAVVLEAWSRRIVGWSMANHLRTAPGLDAFERALGPCRPVNLETH